MKSNNELKETDVKSSACYCLDDIIKIEDFKLKILIVF